MRLLAVLASALLFALPALCQQTLGDLPDPFMGDYQGTLSPRWRPAPRQVICWGRGLQANLLPTLERAGCGAAWLRWRDVLRFGMAMPSPMASSAASSRSRFA